MRSKFAIYLYGSESQGFALSSSDVDFVVLSEEKLSRKEAALRWSQPLRLLNPNWRNRKFDFYVIHLHNESNRPADDILILSNIKYMKQLPLIGEDLLPNVFTPTWDNYFFAEKLRLNTLIQENLGAGSKQLYSRVVHAKRTKFLYQLCFAATMYLELKSHPQVWRFTVQQISHPLMKDAEMFLRMETGFDIKPQLDFHVKVNQLCVKIAALVESIKSEVIAS